MMSIENNTRLCTQCNEEKDCSQFYKDISKSSGYKSACKFCVKAKKRNNSKKPQLKPRRKIKKGAIFTEKIECKSCHRPKAPSKFYKRNNRLIQTCMDCRKQNRKEIYEPKKTSLEKDIQDLTNSLEAIIQLKSGLKKCKSCQIWKEYPQFRKRERTLSGRASICKVCSNISKKGDQLSPAYIQARRSLDERNARIIKLTLQQKDKRNETKY